MDVENKYDSSDGHEHIGDNYEVNEVCKSNNSNETHDYIMAKNDTNNCDIQHQAPAVYVTDSEMETASEKSEGNESQKQTDDKHNERIIKDALSAIKRSQRKVSLDPRLMYGNRGIHKIIYEEEPTRKISMDNLYLNSYSRPHSRKTSLDPFYSASRKTSSVEPFYNRGDTGYPRQKISIVSTDTQNSGSHLDYTEDTWETLPHAEHYTEVHTILPDLKQRATLDVLRHDDVS